MSKKAAEKSGPCCKRCRFWIKWKDDFLRERREEGTCVRFPPKYCSWSETAGHDWCGEFSPREG